MKNKMKSVLLGVVTICSIGMSAYAGATDFNVGLPMLSGETTAVDWKTKTSGIDGSNLKFNTATTGRGYVFARTRLYFINSKQAVNFSPSVKLSTTSNTNHWLGGYVEHNANVKDRVQLKLKSDVWNGDRAAGTWDYK